ncbi:MAG: heparinase II/III family protein, partial [Oscillospiraceae bacterium]|nr:heparinase II/III family protein [Oscillospiraceae bacterium]
MKYVDPEQKTESTILTGYGIALLRDGAKYDSASDSTATNNMRDIWVTFGRSASHGHNDALNLGMDAYGLDIAPDLGYPEATSYTPNRSQWVSAAISHNTVVVNEANHDLDITHGYPLHFDDTEMVKLIDVDESNRNSQTEKYRRSVVMIKANDDVSYAVDFFRVKGGNTHTYSFHSQAENAYPISGIELTEQKDENGNWIGTYAGVDGKDPETGEWIEYGPDPWTKDEWGSPVKYNRGYTWMDKIRRDKDPEQNISVEFDVQDYNKILKDSKGIKLRLTQMNNFTPDEVAIVAGYVPIKDETKRLPRRLDYMLVHNRGENLDSLFTTVLEPYKGERYVSDIKTVDVSVKAGTAIEGEDMARAVKVAHTNGRVDYVVYASNTGVTYTVSDTFVKADGTEIPISFDFRGFVGVYTVNENGACIYRYVNDGDIIGDDGNVIGKTASYTGTVTGFQKEDSFKNYIDVEMQCDDLSDLVGRVIYVDNDRVENGAYRILSASHEGEGLKKGSIRLDIGTVTLIRSLIDKVDFDKGFVYNIKEGQNFTIPTSFEDESLPVFEPVSDNLSTSAGSSIVVNISAKSPIETDTPTVTYIGTTLPRGASIDAETGVFTWKPTSSQVGDNH